MVKVCELQNWISLPNNYNSPDLTGTPTAPTAGIGTSTNQIATTAFVLSQGFSGATGSMPFAKQTSTSVVTSATTTFVTAITTNIVVTASNAPVSVKATATLTTTTAASVAQYRVTVNGVASQIQLLTLSAVATNYTAAMAFISATLGPGTYTVTFDIARSSGTGTVNFFEGSLNAIALQGTSSNGITQLNGDVTTIPGSGLQTATIANAVVTGAKIAASTITGSNIAASTITNSNILTADALKITTGTLPTARGGTNMASWTAGSIPYLSSSSQFAQDNNHLFYDATNRRFYVGTNTGSGTLNVIAPSGGPTTLGLNVFSQTANHSIQVQNQAAMALEMINANAGGGGQFTGCLTRATISRGTLTTRTQALNGDQVWRMSGLGYYDASHTGGETNFINFALTENYTSTAQGGEINFGTTPNGSSASVQRLKIANSGESVFSNAIATANYTTTQKNSLIPSPGWVVFDTDLAKLSYYNGVTWINL